MQPNTPEAATVYKIFLSLFLSPGIGAVSRNFETNVCVAEDIRIQSYLQQQL